MREEKTLSYYVGVLIGQVINIYLLPSLAYASFSAIMGNGLALGEGLLFGLLFVAFRAAAAGAALASIAALEYIAKGMNGTGKPV